MSAAGTSPFRMRRAVGTRCSRWRFRALVIEACKALPVRFRANLRNVGLTIEERPPAELPDGQHTLGYYTGTPLTERGAGYTMTVPDKITIYRAPLMEFCHNRKELRIEVRRTIWHEVAHYFGLDDDQLPY